MGFGLIHERFSLRRIVTENTAESAVEGTFSIPDRLPEIGRGLLVRPFVQKLSTDVRDDQVVFEGTLGVQFLYTHFEERAVPVDQYDDDAEGEDDALGTDAIVIEEHVQIARVHEAIPFAYALDLPGVTEDAQVQTDIQVAASHFEVRPDRMSVDVDAMVSISAWISEVEEQLLAVGVEGQHDLEIHSEKVGLVHVHGEANKALDTHATLDFAGKVKPERLLFVDAKPIVSEAYGEDGDVIVKGHVNYGVFYVAEEGSQSEWGEWPLGTTFEARIPVEGATRNSAVHVKATAGDAQFHLVEAEEGPRLDVRTPIDLHVTVEQARDVGLITMLASETKEIATLRREVQLLERVGESRQTDRPTSVLELPDGLPPIDRLLFGRATARVDDVHVLGDKVAVEINVDVELTYSGRSGGEGSVHTVTWPGALTVDTEIPVRGAEPGLDRRVKTQVNDVHFDLLNRQAVEVSTSLETEVSLSREIDVEVVDEAVEVPPMEEERASYTFVVVRPGDTVWKLAAYYRSDPEMVLAINEGLSSIDADLTPGMKLCVPTGKGQ